MRYRWFARIGNVLLACMVTGFVLVASMQSQPASVAFADQPDDLVALRELAQRLIAPPYPGPDGHVQTAELRLGQLPDDLPLALPTPPNGRIVGSDVRRSGTRSLSWDVVFDAPGTVADITTFYGQQLPGLGWTPAPSNNRSGNPRGGFQPSTSVTGGIFCQKSSGPYLMVTSFAKANAPTDVRVRVEASNAGPCNAQGGGPSPDLLPVLSAPQGVSLQQAGSSVSPNRQTSDATALTEQSAASLEAGFAQQLQAAGWTRVAGNADGPLAWSVWKVPGDGDFQGFLYTLEASGQNRRNLHVQVESSMLPVGSAGTTAIVPQAPTAPPIPPAISTSTPVAPAAPAGGNPTPTP